MMLIDQDNTNTKTPQKQLTGCDKDRGANKNVGLFNTVSHFSFCAKHCVCGGDDVQSIAAFFCTNKQQRSKSPHPTARIRSSR